MSKEFEFNPDKSPDEGGNNDIGGKNQHNVEPSNVDEINPNIDIITKPVVIFFGPTQVGKTMVLMRMLKYFDKGGKISFKVNDDFISDSYFENVKDKFMEDYRKQNKLVNATVGFNFLL